MTWEILGCTRNVKLFIERLRYIRRGLKRTVLCNNCLAGMIYNDYRLQFCSPFINLMIPTMHYIEILKEIEHISKWGFVDISSSRYKYPVGLLNSKWEVHFMHYNSYEEATTKWFERVARMDMNNLYVILVETHSCRIEDLVEFDKLSFRNKIALTSRDYSHIKSLYKLRDYDGQNTNGEIFWPSNRWGTRKYEQYNWLRFLELRD